VSSIELPTVLLRYSSSLFFFPYFPYMTSIGASLVLSLRPTKLPF